MNKILKYAAPVVLMAGLVYTPSATANPMGLMAYDSAGGSVTGTTFVAGQSMTLNGTTTDWAVSGTGSFTTPPAKEDVSTLDVSSTGAGTLTIIYSVSGVVTPNSTLNLGLATTDLSPGVTVTDHVFVDSSHGGADINTTLADVSTGSQVGGTLSLGTINVTSGSGLAPGTPYTLTEELIITATAAGQTANFSAEALAVPDGGTTMILLGGACCAIGALRRKMATI